MAEKWKGSCCSLPMDQPCALHGNIKKVCKECKLPLLWPDWNVIHVCANVLIHSVNSSHVPTVLVNHEGLCDVNRLLVSPWPSLRHLQRLNAMTVRYHHDHTVVIHCVIMISVVKSCRLPYAPHLLHLFHWRHRTLSIRLTRTVPVTWRSFLPSSWSRFMNGKKLSVVACNRSVLVKSNLTFDLRDEPAVRS